MNKRKTIGMICLDCAEKFEQTLILEYGVYFALNNENCPRCKSPDIVNEEKLYSTNLKPEQQQKIVRLEEGGVFDEENEFNRVPGLLDEHFKKLKETH